ncbi:hypothetical protein ABMA27_003919 [Loxostege sticticalis]|uniref:RNA-directed DNA polymerase n=1 Tax=Loxostege sticticalis TaxID=481309 RepID=A0ABR3HQS6_LOXSC
MAVNITTDQFQKLLETISSSRRSTLASCTASFNGEKNSEAVESFLAAVNVYKEIEKITDSEALAGLPLLLRQEAGKWWQGIKTNVTKWDDFQTRLRDTFAPKKPACLIYHEITSERQRPNEPMESFISKKRMLFSLLTETVHSETNQLDMLYYLFDIRLRERLPRSSFSTYDELLKTAREIEEVLIERSQAGSQSSRGPKIKCAYCRNFGHSIDNCRKKNKGESKQIPKQVPTVSVLSNQQTQAPSPSQPKFSCYGCGAPGVVRTNCPTCASKRTPVKSEQADFCSINIGSDIRARPVISIGISGLQGYAFVDTCAKTSVASYSLYKRLNELGYCFSERTIQISLADGFPKTEKVQMVTVPVSLCGRTFLTNFIVLPKSRDNKTLLGIGFLEKAGIILDLPQFTWHFNDSPDIIYELYNEDFVSFSDAEPTAASTPQIPIESAKRWEEPTVATEAALPKENAQYRLSSIELSRKSEGNKRKRTTFDGYSPFVDYMMRDAQINVHRLDVELSPHSKELFPGPDPYDPTDIEINALDVNITCSSDERFILNFSKIAEPLTRLTKKNAVWTWSEEQELAFQKLKESLTTAPVLRQADSTKPYRIKTDASNYALGAVLVQGEGKDEHPVEYASRLLTAAERNYSTTEREALAVVWAVNKFRSYIEGLPTEIITDHQALQWLMSMKSPNGRLARWALQLQAFDLKIKYVPGRINVVADALSRPPCSDETVRNCGICQVSIDLPTRNPAETRSEQLKDENIAKIVKVLERNDCPEDASYWSEKGFFMNNGLLYCHGPRTDDENAQLVVPNHEWANILKVYHDHPLAGHYGSEKTYEKIAKRYYWMGMRKYIESYIRQCLACQRYKPSNKKPAGLLQTSSMNQRFEVIAFDLFGPLPESTDGKTWIFIVEDIATRWIELFALDVASAENCAKALIDEIFLRYGMPRRVTSDNGPQFVSAVMQQVTFCLQIKHSFTPVYHPEANPVERRNRDLKTQLAILVEHEHRQWSQQLACIRFAMNSSTCSSTEYTPAFLTFGRELRTPDDTENDLRAIVISENFIPEITPKLLQLAETFKRAKEIQEGKEIKRKEYVDKSRRQSPVYQIGDLVLVTLHSLSNASKGYTSKLAPRRDGPYAILKQSGPASYVIGNPATKEPQGVYHSSALTPYRGEQSSPPTPVQPLRKRGRPKKPTSVPTKNDLNPIRRGRGRPKKQTTS